MDGGSTILIILVLLALHALIALANGALANARHPTLRELADHGNTRARLALRLAENQADRLRLTVLVMTTALQVAIAALAMFNLIDPAAGTLPLWLTYTLTGAVTVMITIALGEMVPEAIGTLHADRLTPWLVPPLRWLMIAFTPVTSVLTAFSTAIGGLFGSAGLVNRVTEEEIMTLVDAGHTGGSIEQGEKEMIYSVLTLDQTRASELMVPRIDIVAVEAKTPLAELDQIFFESGYSRLPVYDDNIDNIRGLIIAKDLLMAAHNGNRDKLKVAGDLIRPTVFVPETKLANELLKDLRAKRVHMAIVVDEYGGTAGLVTIEDLLEQIVGEIQDEYDVDEEAEYTAIGENTWRMDASIDVDDVNDLLDVGLPTEESDTLGGLIYTKLGRVPFANEEVELDPQVLVRVEQVEGRRIRAVTVRRVMPASDDGSEREEAPADRTADNGTQPARQAE